MVKMISSLFWNKPLRLGEQAFENLSIKFTTNYPNIYIISESIELVLDSNRSLGLSLLKPKRQFTAIGLSV